MKHLNRPLTWPGQMSEKKYNYDQKVSCMQRRGSTIHSWGGFMERNDVVFYEVDPIIVEIIIVTFVNDGDQIRHIIHGKRIAHRIRKHLQIFSSLLKDNKILVFKKVKSSMIIKIYVGDSCFLLVPSVSLNNYHRRLTAKNVRLRRN